MRKSTIIIQLLLLIILLISIIFRYPYIPHEYGGMADGLAQEIYVNNLVTNGYQTWILSPFSYFGMYPFSQPSGQITLAGMFQLTTTTHGELTYLFMSIIYAFIGCISIFMFIQKISDGKSAIITTLFFSTIPYFILWTYWGFSLRGAAISFVPLFVYSLYKISLKDYRHIIIFCLFTFLMSVTHRMFVYLSLWVIALIIAKILEYKFHDNNQIKPNFVRYIILSLFIALYIINIMNIQYLPKIAQTYNLTKFNDVGILFSILNFFYKYIVYIGILFIFFVFGSMLYILYNKNDTKF